MISLVLAMAVMAQTDPAAPVEPTPPAVAPATSVPHPLHLRWDWHVDVPVASALTVAWVLSEFVIKKPLAPTACRWCATNSFDTSIRAVFNPTRTPSAFGLAGPDTASYMTGMVALPIVMLGLDALWAWKGGGTEMDWLADTLIMIESTFSALAVSQTTKYIAGRARPYTVDAPAELLATARDPTDHYVSFFSGHTTFAFSLAVSAGLTASLRKYKYAWVTWVAGLSLATATMVLRIAADKHWTTDVLVAMAVGTAGGIAIPLLFHPQEGAPSVNLAVMPNGLAVSGRF